MTTATSRFNADFSTRTAAPETPRPQPITSAWQSLLMSSAALAIIASGISGSTCGWGSASQPTFTFPAPVRIAARLASSAAPSMPAAPPMITQVPRLPLWALAGEVLATALI